MIPVQNPVPLRFPPVATWTLIAICTVVFLVENSLDPGQLELFLSRFALIPARYLDSEPFGFDSVLDYLPFVANMFLHGGWLHLILNMWMLWLFGGAVEDRFGRVRYLAFYIACGIVASITHAFFNATSTVPALGASGAIAGVLGAHIRMFPMARIVLVIPVLFFPFFFELPAVVFVGIWFVTQLLQGTAELFAPSTGGGIAWWAHIGGFVAGLLLTPALRRSSANYRPYYHDEGVLGFGPFGDR